MREGKVAKGPYLNVGSDITNKGLDIPKTYGYSKSPYEATGPRHWENAFAKAERKIVAADRRITKRASEITVAKVETVLVAIRKIERNRDAILDKDHVGLEVLHAHAKTILAEKALRDIGSHPSLEKIDSALANADSALELLKSAFGRNWEGVPQQTRESAKTLNKRAGAAVRQAEEIASKYQGVL